MKIGPWQLVESGCGATRVIIGGNIDNIKDRVAFIEKTPRVRVRPESQAPAGLDYLNWAPGPFKGDGPDDEHSRDWCDAALILFGYTFDI